QAVESLVGLDPHLLDEVIEHVNAAVVFHVPHPFRGHEKRPMRGAKKPPEGGYTVRSSGVQRKDAAGGCPTASNRACYPCVECLAWHRARGALVPPTRRWGYILRLELDE